MRWLLAVALSLGCLGAEEVRLRTGNWPVDQTRSVDLSDFDYKYSISFVARNTYIGSNLIEFEDGSLWKLAKMSDESESYYEQLDPPVEVPVDHEEWAVEETLKWEKGDSIVLHKIASSSFLAYNLTKEQLFNVEPYAPSLVGLEIVSREDRFGGFRLQLSDESSWKASGSSAWWHRKEFESRVPVAMAKNTPFSKSLPVDVMKQGVYLINMKPYKRSNGSDYFYALPVAAVKKD